jgi:hypothetical protein
MPARKIPLNYRNITGFVQSDKSDDYTYFESSLERDALLLAEYDKSIVSFKTQPKRFYFELEGKRRHYTPDIFVTYNNGLNLFVEVKYRRDLYENWRELKPKFKAVIHSLRHESNTRFKIWTELEIRTPYLKNVTFLLPYKKRPVEDYQVQTIHKILNRMDSLTPKELISLCSGNLITQAEFLNSLWYCIANDLVKIDLFREMTMDSPIWIDHSSLIQSHIKTIAGE